MSHPSKRKGDAAELEAAALLSDILGVAARRKLGAGRQDDQGDIDGVPDTVIQVANYSDITRALREKLAECPTQQANAGATFGASMIRRPGGRWFFALTPEQFATLWLKAVQQSCSHTVVASDPVSAHRDMERHYATTHRSIIEAAS